jgi:hypothetical protein
MWEAGSFSGNQGCIEIYPREKKRNRGRKTACLFLMIFKSKIPAQQVTARYAHTLCPGNRRPHDKPAIIDIRRGITGRK